jgi:type I restriction enzyme R subunit
VGGVEVNIVAERVEYYGPSGELITESYRDFSRKKVKEEFASLDDFLRSWNNAEKKQAIIELLEEHGIILENLAQEVGKEYGDFDLICHIAYDQPPLTRKERAENVKKRDYFTKYGDQARAVLSALLDKYADEGVATLENPKVLKLKPFSDMGTPMEIINQVFGGKTNYANAIQELEQELYSQEQTA